MNIKTRMRFRLIALAYLILITFLFLLPGSALPKENWFDAIYLDKWIHIFLFATLVFLWLLAFPSFSRSLFYFALAAILYGILIELSQEYFIINRSLDWFDVMADGAGVIVGIMFWRVYKKNKPL